MCTATWLALDPPSSYLLCFNRDESRLRGRALPPARVPMPLHAPDGPEILAPLDTDAGGTWIAVNSFGVTVCLLNRYQDAERFAVPAERRRSRGLLVLDLAGGAGLEEIATNLRQHELDRYPAFTLLAAAPDMPPVSFHWSGRGLLGPQTPDWPVCSSGYDADAATRARAALWQELSDDSGGTPEQALRLHRSHQPRRGALSPCMHRTVASTVSLTIVRVETDHVSMRYADGPPCTTALGAPQQLAR